MTEKSIEIEQQRLIQQFKSFATEAEAAANRSSNTGRTKCPSRIILELEDALRYSLFWNSALVFATFFRDVNELSQGGNR